MGLRPRSGWRIWAAVAAFVALAPLALYALAVGMVAKTEIALGVSREWAVVASLAIALGVVGAFVIFDRSGGDEL